MNEEKVLGVNASVMLGINYFVPIIGIIAIIAEPNSSRRTRFHSLQAIFLTLFCTLFAGITCGFGSVLFIYPLVVGILMLTGTEHRVPLISQLCDNLLDRQG
ncbi:MAG: hypothetical protein ACOX88_03050 [Christensenellales bacterium]